MKMKVPLILIAILSFIFGILVFTFTHTGLSGNVAKSSADVGAYLFLIGGVSLILVIGLFNAVRREDVQVTNAIKKYPVLEALTEDALKDPYINRNVSYLSERLRTGRGSGEGSKGSVYRGNVEGTDIEYLRLSEKSKPQVDSRGKPLSYKNHHGSMLFFRTKGPGEYEIVAATSTDRVDIVERKLRKIFSEKGDLEAPSEDKRQNSAKN